MLGYLAGPSQPPEDDWYSVNVQAGQSISIQSSTPSDQGGQFVNTASMEVSLYDTYGKLATQGVKLDDGRNVSLSFRAPVSGQYRIDVSADPGGAGEYFLQVNTAPYPSGSITGQVYNDLTGSGSIASGDPALQGWEVNLVNSNGTLVAAQLTDAEGDFNFGGLDPGSYTVEENLPSGWTQTAPAATGTFTVTVSAGGVVSGLQFGNFQDISISGEKFDNLNGNGSLDPGEPGLQGWTILLFDATGNLIATTVTDADGNYSFPDVGPGTYTVQEEMQSGWVQSDPGGSETYTVVSESGLNETGLNFGNYQPVEFDLPDGNDLIYAGAGNDLVYGDNFVSDPNAITTGTNNDTICGQARRRHDLRPGRK